MRVIVAGAAGFLGGYLLETLLASGVEPAALARRSSDLRLINHLGIEKRFFDLSDPDSIYQALRGGEIIFNAMGKVADWGGWEEFYQVNVRGTRNLLSAAIANQVRRIVHISSISAYGMRFLGSSNLHEDTPYRPSPVGRDFYCKSKFLAEQQVKIAAAGGDIEYVILRPGIIVGERDSAISRRIFSIVQGHRRVLNVGRLEDRVQFNHARDVARAAILAGLHGPRNEVYNVSSPPEITKFEFWSRVLRALRLRKKIVEVPYSAALLAGWMSEYVSLLLGNGREPDFTLWSVYLMGSQSILESSKMHQLGWRRQEDLAETIEGAFRNCWNRDETKQKG